MTRGTDRARGQGGPWTTHGHEIPGVTVSGPGRPKVYRCGGPKHCVMCAVEIARGQEQSYTDTCLGGHVAVIRKYADGTSVACCAICGVTDYPLSRPSDFKNAVG